MSKFQLILLVVFGAFILIAVIVFSISRAGSGSSAAVVVWGDIPNSDWNDLVSLGSLNRDRTLTIQYVEKSPDSLMQEFTEALSEGRGPDLIILRLEDYWRQKNRLLPIPYGNISERDFKNTFAEEGELFLAPEGIYALPLSIDPLVLYYNRDLLTRAGHAVPLAYWDGIFEAAAKLTKRDPAGNITKSVMALGEANNIPNFKSILSLLMLQAGTPITARVNAGEVLELRPQLRINPDLPVAPAESALDFYTQFSNPAKSFYSWNRSLLPAQTHFTAGDGAYYIGFASELRVLRAKNPTLNLGVAPVPQSRVSERSSTFGVLRGVAISRGAKNSAGAYATAIKLVSRDSAKALSNIMLLPPARRDLLAERPADAVLSVFWESALQSRGWIDPDSERTKTIFREIIESVTSGRARVSEAIGTADSAIEALIK